MSTHAAAIAALAVVVLTPLPIEFASSLGSPSGDGNVVANAGASSANTVDVYGTLTRADELRLAVSQGGGAPVTTETVRDQVCAPSVPVEHMSPVVLHRCVAGSAYQFPVPTCDAGDPLLQALFRRDLVGGVWSEWRFVAPAQCTSATVTLSGAEFRSLPLVASTVNVQPATTEVLVNKPTIAYTSGDPQLLTTTVLGVPVEVEAKPTAFRWDFADGEPFTTSSPGHPYPSQDVTHAWRTPGTWTITLTTTWSGRYRVVGTQAWRDVVGTATTTSTSPPITSVEHRAHLVAGDCLTDPLAAGCG